VLLAGRTRADLGNPKSFLFLSTRIKTVEDQPWEESIPELS